jgi:quercetin dioxygenase-like cupin family protein
MDVRRRTAIKVGGAAALFAVTRQAMAGEANPLTAAIAPDGQSMKVVRVLRRNDGRTRVAEGEVAADNSPYPLFKQFLTHNATTTAIYSAPPHHRMPASKNTANALLFVVAGETTLKAGGSTQRCPAGTAILMDAGSGAGLSETAGPAGYTAIKVQLAD